MQLHTRLTEFLLTLALFLFAYAFSLTNVLKVERLFFRFLENSLATSLLLAVCVCFFCPFS